MRSIAGSIRLLAACVACAACTGSVGEPGSPDPIEPLPFVCDPAARGRANADMRRLTTPELTASLRDVFGPAIDSAEVAALLPSLPSEPVMTREIAFDGRIRDVEALEGVASAIARRVVTDPATSRAVLGCESSDAAACRAAFLDRLARRLFRRPLTDAERASYTAFMDDLGADGLEWAIVRAIVSPHFHQALELEGVATGDGRRRVDAYAVASRLSFFLTGSLPDEALLAAAERNELDSLDTLRMHAERLLATDAGRARVRDTVLEWIGAAPPDPSPILAERAGIDPAGLGDEAHAELVRFIDHVVFERRGTFEDLLADPTVFPSTDRLAAIYELSVSDEPVVASGAARGLLLRPATLLTARLSTSPIVRGATLRRRVLCEVYPTPDPAIVAGGIAVHDSLSPAEHSNRERWARASEGAACATCHTRINAVGFALESYGPMGEWRDTEIAFDETGAEIASFPIDATVDDLLIGEAGGDAGSLAATIAESDSARSCFAENAFASQRKRLPAAPDTCLMDELDFAIDARPVLDVFVGAVVNEDVFYRAEGEP